MNFKWCHCGLAAALLVSSLYADDLTPAQALDNLEKAAASDPTGARISQMVPYWRKALERESYQELEDLRIPDGESDGEPAAAQKKFEKEISEFSNSIQRQKAERIRIETERITALLNEAGKTIENAQKPEDLDDVIKSLLQIKVSRYTPYDEGTQSLQQQIQTARQIAAEWQVYLNEKQFRRSEPATKSLDRISHYLTTYPLVARSKVLRMIKEETGIAPRPQSGGNAANAEDDPSSLGFIQRRFVEDGDIDGALKALEGIPQSNRISEGDKLRDALISFKRFQASAGALSPEEAIKYLAALPSNSLLLPLCQKEVNRIISNSLKVPAPPEPISTDRYIRFLAEDATARENWEQAVAIWNLGTPLRVGDGDSAAISAYLKGQEFEKAGMWTQAIGAYRSGLEGRLVYMPIGKFTTRLQAMQKLDPKRYEQANADADTLERLGKERESDIYRHMRQSQRYESPAPSRGQKSAPASEEMIGLIRQEIRGVLDERKEAAEHVKPEPAKPAPAQEPSPTGK
jgi:hypothetical protein